MKKLIAVGSLLARCWLVNLFMVVVFSGIAWAYCHADPVCKMQCERECFASDIRGNCIQYCDNICQVCN